MYISFINTTVTQQKYAPIEKEFLAVAHCLQFFKYYTYESPVIIQTDHKPLIGLVDKPCDELSPRLQSLRIRTRSYNLTFMYKPGKLIEYAAMLSRAPLPEEKTCINATVTTESVKERVLTLLDDMRLKQLQKATREDTEMRTLARYVEEEWPIKKEEIPEVLKPFLNHTNELSVQEGIICRDRRLVIPKVLQDTVLKELHKIHHGVTATLSRARETVYWPGMTKTISNMVQSCEACASYQNKSQQHKCKQENNQQGHGSKLQQTYTSQEKTIIC